MDVLTTAIVEAVRNQEQPTKTVLSSLLAIQDAMGYIPKQSMEVVASEVPGTTVNDVWAVASFYPNFKFEPRSECTVEICWGPTCHIAGAMGIFDEALNLLGLESEGKTSDGSIELDFNTCLGACAQAPVISVNHHLIGRVTKNSLKDAIEKSN
ncbi:MAG: NADP-reducing hydrogenase subunit HndA [Chloroflexota bacterium]|jgi:NADH:ubiquinone oxidoreductase subunit E|nr:NAD(P)H-dependent oxidoreductase subunit E [Dehalococcoidia bacterium]CAI8358467.1 MAG: NADP-reducing hydrogenase subunit HndA [Chloroflexota bacterium]|tara:strand:- start:874 stop:1335 length:462 start_codon:yes stop_codon:yes gene_type:complete